MKRGRWKVEGREKKRGYLRERGRKMEERLEKESMELEKEFGKGSHRLASRERRKGFPKEIEKN